MLKTKRIREISIPSSSLGNDRKITVIGYGKPSSSQKVYIQAGLHADEPPGFVVMHYLLKLLDQADKAGKINQQIVLVPVANPIGLSQWENNRIQGRFEQFNGVNFNRAYPDLTDKVASKVKTKLQQSPKKNLEIIRKAQLACLDKIETTDEGDFLKKTLLSLATDADICLDLHCDYEACLHIYMGTPLWPDASDLVAQMGSKVTLLAKKSGGDPFDEACSKIWWELAERFPDYPIPNGCLSATVELRGGRDVSHENGSSDAKNIYHFLVRRGYIKGKAPVLPRVPRAATPLAGVEHVKTPTAGVVIFTKQIGESVKKGDVIAEIVNPIAKNSAERVKKVKCKADGILFTKIPDRYAKPNRLIAKIAGKKPLKGKGDHLLTAK